MGCLLSPIDRQNDQLSSPYRSGWPYPQGGASADKAIETRRMERTSSIEP